MKKMKLWLFFPLILDSWAKVSIKLPSLDFGGNGSTPIPWGPCYCVVIALLLSCYVAVIVLLLSCYLAVTVLLLCCYCRASLLLLSCYCAVLLLLFVFVVLLYTSRCIAGHCALHFVVLRFCELSARAQARLDRAHKQLLGVFRAQHGK